MINKLSVVSSTIHVHAGETSLKTTKAFTHGGLVFDQHKRLATFGKLDPVAIPAELELVDGKTLDLQLVAPDGTVRKQTRVGVLKQSQTEPGIFRIAGMSKTPKRFSAEDGWGTVIYKYRAYLTHPGAKTDEVFPEWLKSSVGRQTALWNRLAWLCRQAWKECSPVPTEQIAEFVGNTILPAIDSFNDSLGRERTKEKIKHPTKLKVEMPSLDALWSFVGHLRGRIEKNREVPEGLLEKVVEFAQPFKPDYSPMNKFLSSVPEIAKREAEVIAYMAAEQAGMKDQPEQFRLLHYEFGPTVKSFQAVLSRRKTTKVGWAEGWPKLKYADRPKAADWGLHFYFNKAGVKTSDLYTPKGVPGLTFGAPLKSANTGHQLMTGGAAKRELREAEISIGGQKRQQCSLRFAVLLHRPLPPDSHCKEWKLINSNGALWLCLTVELQRPVPVTQASAAGMDIGWRRTESGIRFGMLFEPNTNTFRELTVGFQLSPKDPTVRTPFRIDLGPTRWEKRNIIRLIPDWKPGDPIPSTIELRAAMQKRRSYHKDTAKVLLKKHLGDSLPAWFDKAGSRGLLKLAAEDFKDDAVVQDIVGQFRKDDAELGALVSMYLERSTKRLEYGQQQVAHDVCRHLQEKGINRLVIESNFLAKASQNQDNDDPVSLQRSQKYRQFVAAAKFVSALRDIMAKYGMVLDEFDPMDTTRICHYCNHRNESTEKESLQCAGCNRVIFQDQNAAVNLSRFGTAPEMAESALGSAKP